MQSEDRVSAALAAISPQITLYRVSVSAALDRVRSMIAAESGASQVRATLGDLGARLIDADRMAMVFSGAGPLDSASTTALERAAAILEELLNPANEPFVVDVPPGTSFIAAVRNRLSYLGLGFGAAGIHELVRQRSYDPAQHETALGGYPFERWSASERRRAPPLIVRVQGSDLDALALAPLLDGCVRFVLMIDSPTTVAPLARLISPGVFVAQCGDLQALQSVVDYDGPVVIAAMSADEACFTHDPRAGNAAWQRVTLVRIPDVVPRKSFALRSVWQQRDDVAHLRSLAERPVWSASSADPLAMPASGSNAVFDPAERLTAWLLEQTVATSGNGGGGPS